MITGGTLFALFLASISWAQEIPSGIQIDPPLYGGTGCTRDTVSATLSPDAQVLSLIFDAFTTQAGSGTGKAKDLKFCHLGINIRIPKGYTVSIPRIDYRGFAHLPLGAQASLNSFSRFPGTAGLRFVQLLRGEMDDDYLMPSTSSSQAPQWSACGQNALLTTDLTLNLQANTKQDFSVFTLDSGDLKMGVVYYLDWKRCTPRPIPPHRRS